MRIARTPRSPVLPILVVVVVLAGLLSGCGVAADDRAAVVLGTPVPTGVVDELAADEAFLQAVGGGLPGTESVVPGDSARAALTFEIQRTAAQTELGRWEPELAGRSPQELAQALGFDEARALVESQVPPGLSDTALGELTAFVAFTTRLGERLQSLGGQGGTVAEEDLRLLYDGAPGLWDRTCVAVLAVAEERVVTVSERVVAGGRLEDVVGEVEGAELVFDPAEECVPTAQLPDGLRDEVRGAVPGATLGPVVLESERTGPIAVFFRVEGTERVAFGDPAARRQLEGLVGQFASAQAPSQAAGLWLSLLLAGGVEVNPRYGRAAVGVSGAFEVVAPDAPEVLVTGAPLPLPQVQPVPEDVPPGAAPAGAAPDGAAPGGASPDGAGPATPGP